MGHPGSKGRLASEGAPAPTVAREVTVPRPHRHGEVALREWFMRLVLLSLATTQRNRLAVGLCFQATPARDGPRGPAR